VAGVTKLHLFAGARKHAADLATRLSRDAEHFHNLAERHRKMADRASPDWQKKLLDVASAYDELARLGRKSDCQSVLGPAVVSRGNH
jgi:hypothetical protein